MNVRMNFIGFYTIVRMEIMRQLRIWPQTLLLPVITMSLYFLIFGTLIGTRIGEIEQFSYMQYITPGLVMMSIVSNAYANVSTSFYLRKFQKSIEELLISPLHNLTILLGFLTGGVLRGVTVGVLVGAVSLFFTKLHIQHPLTLIAIMILTATLFSLAGFINGMIANSFDDIFLVPTFVLTPLTYLGGVFFSVNMLPGFWGKIALANPILYLINACRFAVLGISDVPVSHAFSLLIGFTLALLFICFYMMQRGIGIKN